MKGELTEERLDEFSTIAAFYGAGMMCVGFLALKLLGVEIEFMTLLVYIVILSFVTMVSYYQYNRKWKQ
jgi:hypothetical protein